jgi:hypothetical protein
MSAPGEGVAGSAAAGGAGAGGAAAAATAHAATLDVALDEAGRVVKKQRTCASTSGRVLDELIAAVDDCRGRLPASGSGAAAAVAELAAALAARPAVREANAATKDLHGAIAKLGKALERAFDLGADASKALTPAPEAEAEEQAGATLTAILLHLLREGEPEAARSLAAEAGVPLPDALAAPFAAVHAVLARLRARDLGPALAWAAEHRAALAEGGAGARLELRLHSLGFVAALRSPGGGAPAALAYARAHLAPFHAAFPRETQRLMGALLFAGRPPGPYADLLDDARWAEAGHELSRLACRLMGQARAGAVQPA